MSSPSELSIDCRSVRKGEGEIGEDVSEAGWMYIEVIMFLFTMVRGVVQVGVGTYSCLTGLEGGDFSGIAEVELEGLTPFEDPIRHVDQLRSLKRLDFSLVGVVGGEDLGEGVSGICTGSGDFNTGDIDVVVASVGRREVAIGVVVASALEGERICLLTGLLSV